MAAGGNTGGFGNMGSGQQSMQPMQSSGGYQPSPLMFGQQYSPTPTPAPTQAPATNRAYNSFGNSIMGGFPGLWNIPGIWNKFGKAAAPSPAPSPAAKYKPVTAPATKEPMYQTPETPPSGYRPSSSAPPFFQPIYQSQYPNYGMFNPYNVSMYGMDYQSPFMGGYGPFMGYQQPYMGNMGIAGLMPQYEFQGD